MGLYVDEDDEEMIEVPIEVSSSEAEKAKKPAEKRRIERSEPITKQRKIHSITHSSSSLPQEVVPDDTTESNPERAGTSFQSDSLNYRTIETSSIYRI